MKKNITMNITWVCWLLWLMGVIFLGIGILVAFIVQKSGSVSPQEAELFYPLFLGVFGSFGLGMILAGTIVFVKIRTKEKLHKRLVQDGNYVWADILEIAPNYNMSINGRVSLALRCKYRHSDGQTYLFKSGYLRFNPENMLINKDKIKVWFDRGDIKKYYVDVDASINNDIVEL